MWVKSLLGKMFSKRKIEKVICIMKKELEEIQNAALKRSRLKKEVCNFFCSVLFFRKSFGKSFLYGLSRENYESLWFDTFFSQFEGNVLRLN